MKNRRQHYRHEFPPTRPISVKLQSADGAVVLGELIDLSIGGMCVFASELKSRPKEKWSISLPLEPDAEPLNMLAEPTGTRSGNPAKCGFRFVFSNEPEEMDGQEKRIWKFLLDAQRRRRRYL